MVFDALLGLVEESEGTAAEAYLTSYPGLGTLIRAGREQGLSGRRILASYREVGGTISDAKFWQLHHGIVAMDLPPYGQSYADLIEGRNVLEAPGGREGLYQVNFRQFIQHDPETGLPNFSVQNFSMTQRELDVGDAIEAMGRLMDAWDNPADSYGRLIGFEVTSVQRYTG